MRHQLCVLNPSETTLFAASELARYLRLIAAEPIDVTIAVGSKPLPDAINLGLLGDQLPKCSHKLENPQLDDAILVNVKNAAGFIGGSNERSVLLGVYRFLYELGCRWVRPGVDGEHVPRLDLQKTALSLDEKAALRDRVLCIEGAVSYENVLNIIDWAPKVGYSGYFIQFPDAYTFFQRWYSHLNDQGRSTEPFSKETARAFTIALEREIKKRSLHYQAVGHGWTCKAIGLNISHWDPYFEPLDKNVPEMLAQLNHKRAFLWDRPMITSLCYSRADVRERLVHEISTYAAAHPEVDALHVWLDDGGSCCECENCRPHRQADLYVSMLQELDRALSAKKIPTRIIFIAYASLLWPPAESQLKLDPNRFSFVYANSRGDYTQALKVPERKDLPIPEFIPNKSKLKRDNDEFCAFLQGWQKFFGGDSMLFEYHFGSWMHTFNPLVLAQVIHTDVRALKPLGFNGLISCQSQRTFLPTGLPCYTLGQTLWNDQLNFELLADDYFHACFGAGSAQCKEFLKVSAEQLARIFEPADTFRLKPDAARQLLRLELMLADFRKIIAANRGRANACHAASWQFLEWYVQIVDRMVALGRAMARNSDADVLKEWQSFRAFLFENEPHYQAGLDLWALTGMFDNYLIRGKFSTAPENVVQQ